MPEQQTPGYEMPAHEPPFEVQPGQAAAADPEPGIVAGHIELFSAEGASGWAFDAARPGRPVVVAAFLGATRLGQTTADTVRPDLRTEIGEGVHGFSLPFSPAVPEDMLEHVHIVAASAGIPSVLRAPEPAAAIQEVRPAAADSAPIFIIGVAPDAADILTRSLIEAMGLSGHGEGHLLPLAQSLIRMTNQYFRNANAAAGPDSLVRRVEAGKIHQAIRSMFAVLMAEQHPQGHWIDNSQGLAGIQATTVLRTIWPRARFIFLSSRVAESVEARAIVGPSRSLSDHVSSWVRDMQAWSEIRDRFRHSALSVDRLSLLRDPAASAAAIGAFLQLDEATTDRLAAVLTETVHASGLPAAAQAADAHPGWDGEAGQALRAASDPVMAAYGYAWDQHLTRELARSQASGVIGACIPSSAPPFRSCRPPEHSAAQSGQTREMACFAHVTNLL
jgi:hypothetical protein